MHDRPSCMVYILADCINFACHCIAHCEDLINLVFIYTARMVAIAAGSAGGGLVFIILLITLMAIIITVTLQKYNKWKVSTLTANVAYTRRSMEKLDGACDATSGGNIEAQQSNREDFTLSMELNIAYQPSAVPMSQNVAHTRKTIDKSSQPTEVAELDMVYDSIVEENTTDVQQSNGEAFVLSTERNDAYKQSTVVIEHQPSGVPMSQNVAYTRKSTEKSSQPTEAAELDILYDSIIEENTTEVQQSNGEAFVLSTERNVVIEHQVEPSAVLMSQNVAYTRKSTEESSQTTEAAELDVVYDSINEETTTEVQQSNGEAFVLSTERNVAYKQSTAVMSSNIAYKFQRGLETDNDREYDYISTDQL